MRTIYKSAFPTFFDSPYQKALYQQASASEIKVNVQEFDDQYKLALVAPGLTKAGFSLKVDQDILTIAYTPATEEKAAAGNWLRKEFSPQPFERKFSLPENGFQEEGIEARYEQGILTVVIPKKAATPQPEARTIEVA